MDIREPLAELSHTRKIFHSEADFQFALAWEIQKAYPTAEIRLEYSPAHIEPRIHIDILVMIGDEWYPIELKYKTIGFMMTCDGEEYKLKSHVAQDLGRYDYLKDVQRIERLEQSMPSFKKGYSLLLTNDPAYWNNTNRSDTVYEEFKLSENMIKTGRLSWASHAGKGTIKGREESITLTGKYTICWENYSEFYNERSGIFKYLILSREAQRDDN